MSEASVAGRFPLKQAAINESGIATHEIVAAVSGKSIRVHSLMFTVGGPVNITWRSGANNLSGAMEFADSGGMAVSSEVGLMWTNPGEALNLVADAAVQISGIITYSER